MAPLVDRLYVYDNSVDDAQAKALFRLSNGVLIKRYEDEIPEWAVYIMP